MSKPLLSDLKKFRYQKASARSAVASTNAASSQESQETTVSCTSGSQLTSPEIGRRRISSGHSPDRVPSSPCPYSPIVRGRTSKRRLLSDSSDGDDAPRQEQQADGAGDAPCSPAPAADDPAANTDKIESDLAFLRDAFPDQDEMELQDCLAQHGWRLDDAMAALADRAEKAARRAQLAALATAKAAPKRRRLVVMESDSSDEEDGRPRPAANGHRQNGAAKPATNGVSRKPAAPKPPKPTVFAGGGDSDDEDMDFEAKCIVYMSDSDDEDDDEPRGPRRTDTQQLASDRLLVVEYLSTATVDELACMDGCSKKKAELIVGQRPYANWTDALAKFSCAKGFTPHMLNSALRVLRMRNMLRRLLQRCEEISLKLKARVAELIEGREDRDKITEQPSNLNSEMRLSPYQMIGLSWLILMYKERLNAVLADEMGLGKTVQAISFLAYLQQQSPSWKYLVVVPSSTLDNWLRELSVWCPSLIAVEYRGSMENRRQTRQEALQDDGWHVMVTTYNIVASAPEDRVFFKNLHFKYIVFDEAHMLKNMASKRYSNLMKLKGDHRLLLTGTPLQNNLVELMSLLVFVMPHMFGKVRKSLQTMFEIIPKVGQESRSSYEAERIEEAKQIMSPFFLRRLKRDVLRDLPTKREEVLRVAMTTAQAAKYRQLRENYVKEAAEKLRGDTKEASQSGVGMMMCMRKLANHPVLMRYYYDEDKLREIAKKFAALPDHEHKEEALVFEDLTYLSDFEVHKTCKLYPRLRCYQLPDELILESGKLAELDRLLPRLRAEGSRVLLFSQFVIMLDVLEAYLRIRGYRYCRLDGQTAVTDRLQLIDKYNNDRDIFVFLLSTRAGGLGINLTSANVVILHDVDFNPHNDRQAEDRCHRIGQTKEVQVIKLICANTIDECMLRVGQEKLSLDRDISGAPVGSEDQSEDPKDVRHLLALALECGD
ncbi:SWI/SNF-related matrix-associated actin-dependent regulator of chromatin subfamily A containing DEAD/H box 1 homolog [Amphibalanus amphitrite]|uniref:SWI/SNF-related matrix-associated actin-dependent regulator of chromatin subfamily A containing DEAD/H box 1 homolog n=1 Tax=Amphibalanus amphitrite TaxID=1232801 RepID=UPI001C90D561|nr:SWI/SNF-related matrix-associated actin-dependent regulator of chromatin subfamily A containing DEAD/H box 1 homolog [Amphibalanus amphitrite]XP_043225768.1 SWI/SNF-related matrix-associated actin-dependent regulator of chromatin subfamily A containing DEAD/H box 1 homolog [Amphibalanus amphitrite]XP_043225769.1 SWI/SNF-related matrix-associated actin-dependent regulator of chromatin subfamily A containing DEAD/H box 1 homolog [Amphibalanus amphitrite]